MILRLTSPTYPPEYMYFAFHLLVSSFVRCLSKSGKSSEPHLTHLLVLYLLLHTCVLCIPSTFITGASKPGNASQVKIRVLLDRVPAWLSKASGLGNLTRCTPPNPTPLLEEQCTWTMSTFFKMVKSQIFIILLGAPGFVDNFKETLVVSICWNGSF